MNNVNARKSLDRESLLSTDSGYGHSPPVQKKSNTHKSHSNSNNMAGDTDSTNGMCVPDVNWNEPLSTFPQSSPGVADISVEALGNASVDAVLEDHETSATYKSHATDALKNAPQKKQKIADVHGWLSNSELVNRGINPDRFISFDNVSDADSFCSEDSNTEGGPEKFFDKSGDGDEHHVRQEKASPSQNAEAQDIEPRRDRVHTLTKPDADQSKFYNLELNLAEFASMLSGFRKACKVEDSQPTYDVQSPQIIDQEDEAPSDELSCSSAMSSWILPISRYQTNGPENSTSAARGSDTISFHRSSDSQNSSPGSGTKRTFNSDWLPRDDESDDCNRKSRKQFPGSLTPDSEGTSEKQIPCFVDECHGKDKHVSEMMLVLSLLIQ